MDSHEHGLEESPEIVEAESTEAETAEVVEMPVTTVRSENSLNRFVRRVGSRSWTILAIAILLAVALWFGRALLIAATIDGRPVGRIAVLHELETRSGRAAVDSLISRRLVEYEAAKQHITVTDAEVTDQIKKIEDQLKAQGLKLDDALAQQNLSRADLKSQMMVQKKIEKLLGDRITVSDTEVDNYIKTNKLPLPKGKEAQAKVQLKEQLRQQKIGQEATKLDAELRAKANITYYGSYIKAPAAN